MHTSLPSKFDCRFKVEDASFKIRQYEYADHQFELGTTSEMFYKSLMKIANGTILVTMSSEAQMKSSDLHGDLYLAVCLLGSWYTGAYSKVSSQAHMLFG